MTRLVASSRLVQWGSESKSWEYQPQPVCLTTPASVGWASASSPALSTYSLLFHVSWHSFFSYPCFQSSGLISDPLLHLSLSVLKPLTTCKYNQAPELLPASLARRRVVSLTPDHLYVSSHPLGNSRLLPLKAFPNQPSSTFPTICPFLSLTSAAFISVL